MVTGLRLGTHEGRGQEFESLDNLEEIVSINCFVSHHFVGEWKETLVGEEWCPSLPPTAPWKWLFLL